MYGLKRENRLTMARKTVSKKKVVVPNPGSISEDGFKSQAAVAGKKPFSKSGGEDLSSVSIHEKVALLAYKYWEERGMLDGSSEEDWYRAEKEVLRGASRGNS